MDVKAHVSLKVNDHVVTARQIEVLAAIWSEGSKAAAAKKLGISVPVAHRYIESLERNIGYRLITSTPRGSVLTEDGMKLVETANRMELRCSGNEGISVSCTPVTEELMMAALSSMDDEIGLIISDDIMNIRLLREGSVDMILLDDPVHLFDLEGYQWMEIGSMDMVHVDRGRSYLEYRYGAQRIAFMHLEASGKEYNIDGKVMSIKELMNSGKSFFVDEVLLVRHGIRLRSATDPRLLRHTINAVYRKDSEKVSSILNSIISKRNYLKR